MQVRKTNPYLEALILLAIIVAAGFVLSPEDPFWTRFPASPYWLVVLLIPLRYGSPYGLVCAAFCAALQLAAFCDFSAASLRSEVFLHPFCLLLPGAFLIAGHFIGEAVYASDKKSEYQRIQLRKLQADNERQASEFSALEQSYRQVEGQVAGETDSLYALLRSLPVLDTVEPYNLPKAVAGLLHRFIKADEFAYWQKREGKWKQIYPLGKSDPLPTLGQVALRESRVVTAREHPEASAGESFEISGAFTLADSGEVHLLAAGNIKFTFWHKRMERLFSAILRETKTAQYRFQQQGILDRKFPFEQQMKLSGESFLRQHVENEIRLQHRSGGISALMFLCPDAPHQHDSRLLTILASALRTLLRTSDTKAYLRDRGVFAAFLPGTAEAGALNAAGKIRTALDNLDLRLDGTPVRFRLEIREVRNLDELQKVTDELQEGRLP